MMADDRRDSQVSDISDANSDSNYEPSSVGEKLDKILKNRNKNNNEESPVVKRSTFGTTHEDDDDDGVSGSRSGSSGGGGDQIDNPFSNQHEEKPRAPFTSQPYKAYRYHHHETTDHDIDDGNAVEDNGDDDDSSVYSYPPSTIPDQIDNNTDNNNNDNNNAYIPHDHDRKQSLSELSEAGEAYKNLLLIHGHPPVPQHTSTFEPRDISNNNNNYNNGRNTPTQSNASIISLPASDSHHPLPYTHANFTTTASTAAAAAAEADASILHSLLSTIQSLQSTVHALELSLQTIHDVNKHNTRAMILNSRVDLDKSYMRVHPLLSDAGRFPDMAVFPTTVGGMMKLNDASLTSLVVFYGLQRGLEDGGYYGKFSALRDYLGIEP